MKVTELIVRTAREHGLRHFFGLPGGGIPLDLMEHGRELGVDFVSVAHESSAAIMAAYNGLLQETAGLALAIKGVGAGNLVGGAVNAYFERLPVVCCCESAPRHVQHQDLVSLCSHEALFSEVSKYRATLTVEHAAEMIRDAFGSAYDGRPGPVLLDLPADMGAFDCGEFAAARPELARQIPDKHRLHVIRQLIQESQRPVVLAGADILRADCASQLLTLAETMQAAVLVSMEAHGVFPESHPRWAGTFVGQFNPETIEGELLDRSDFALLVGMDSLVSDKPWDLDIPTCELSLRTEYESLVNEPAVRVDGDLAVSLQELAGVAPSSGFPLEEIAMLKHQVLRHFERPPNARLAVQDVIAIMREHFPSDGILFSETGVFILMLHHLWPVNRPGAHYGTSGGRTMGLMLPAIVGAKLAQPEIPMVGIGADGSTLMRLGELEVFARTGISVPLVIINDQALGTMKARQKARGMLDYALDLHGVDFAAAAKACGLYGVVIDSPEQFEREFKHALSADRTTLLDVRVDASAYQDSFGATIGALE